MEIWKTMNSPFNNYDISNYGNIRNNKTNYNFNLSSKDTSYVRISLFKKNFLVHRLVAEYFLDNYDNNLIINHKDGNRLNNHIDNLECISIFENNNKIIHKNYGTKFRKIAQYDKNWNLIKIWNRVKDTNINPSILYNSIKNKKMYDNCYWEQYIEKIENEIWKKIKYFDMNIELSNFGRIKRKSGKITYGDKNVSGYYGIRINNKYFRIHRLVCIAFKPIDNFESMVVNHIDGNKKNNHVDNLEWCSYSENTIHSYKLNKKPRNIRKVKIIRINPITKEEKEYDSLELACKENNIKNKSNMISVCKNRRKMTGGYIWKYNK